MSIAVMRRLWRTLLSLSLLVIVSSWVTCYFGVQHEIDKIPQDQRAKMTDFDWTGVEWIEFGMTILIGGVLLGVAGIFLWLVERKRRQGRARTLG
jgi:hypothetical protein